MNKKIIIIPAIICAIIIIICLALILTTKKDQQGILFNTIATNTTQNNSNEENSDAIMAKYPEKITDVKIAYNVGKCINDIIKDFYSTGEFDAEESMTLPDNLVKKLELKNGLKTYYIKEAYKTEMEDNIDVYYTNGYIVKEQSENLTKEELKTTLIIDTEYNTGRLCLYGEGLVDTINYNDDISKTSIIGNKGLKIKKAEGSTKQLDELIMENDLFQNRIIQDNMYESDLVQWYFKDYKIQKAIEKEENFNGNISITYSGNFNDGYIITENNEKNYFLKPGQTPMEYEITEQ